MSKTYTKVFTSKLCTTGSWGSSPIAGEHESTMTLSIREGERSGDIEWDIPSIDDTTQIGLQFEDGELVDYDGVFVLPKQACELIREAGFKVDESFHS